SSQTMGVCSHSAVAALQRSVVHALLSLQLGHVSVICDDPLPDDVRPLPHVPALLASCWMFAGVLVVSPLSAMRTLKVTVHCCPFTKFSGGLKVNFTSNGLVASTEGRRGQSVDARPPLNMTGGGGPGVSPWSTVQTPPATLRQ